MASVTAPTSDPFLADLESLKTLASPAIVRRRIADARKLVQDLVGRGSAR